MVRAINRRLRKKAKLAMKEEVIHKGYVPGAIGKVVELHGTYYAQHWGFGLFFEAKVAAGPSSIPNIKARVLGIN